MFHFFFIFQTQFLATLKWRRLNVSKITETSPFHLKLLTIIYAHFLEINVNFRFFMEIESSNKLFTIISSYSSSILNSRIRKPVHLILYFLQKHLFHMWSPSVSRGSRGAPGPAGRAAHQEAGGRVTGQVQPLPVWSVLYVHLC